MEKKRKFVMANDLVKPKKQVLGEEDMSNLLQRYTPMTVLTLLREVSEVSDVNIDWNAMVRRTSTGISNAREYQMLWRHLAYRNALIDRHDGASQPLDDDSDLECEVEAVPSASSEALAEATAYAKVLMASGASNDPNGSKAEGPLIINIPKGQMLKAPSDSNINNCTQGMSISVPVWVQKKPLPSNMNNEVLEANGTGNSNRRKSKFWSPAKDKKLISAVQKYGEGNWANMLKEEFKGDRTAFQLSQRWGLIRKQQGNLNVGNSPQLSEAQLAARHAVSMALDSRPKLIAAQSNLGQRTGIENSRMASQTRSVPPSPHNPVSTSYLGASSTVPKSRLATEKPSAIIKHDSIPDPDSSMVKAAAIAAGARIATPGADTAQSMPGGGSSLRPPITGIGNSLPSNVHFIRTGLVTKPLSSCPTVPSNTSQTGGSSGKTSIPLSQPNITAVTTSASATGKGKSQFNPGAGN